MASITIRNLDEDVAHPPPRPGPRRHRNRVDTLMHRIVFPGIGTPHDVRERANEPSDWDPDSIRHTWVFNLK